ncbi:uncharacterized protein LOC123319329 [Coccinella septempunctata]|uniref:uncharacterized protein LOC123319329 n=1 Tax=Coccinella septempunctata TaxID=41139 RepID=UPI001D05D2F8|nr:uncharacterized protein LOC123319329 [Coccinella septempunctata]
MKKHYMLALFGLWTTLSLETFALNRVKRLVWPPGGDKVQMIAGVGVPVDLRQETVIFGMVYKATYALPNNITQLQNSNIIFQRQARSSEDSHKNVIKYIERFLYEQNQYSKACVLRTICEAAVSKFDENGGFMNEIMNIIFESMGETIRHHDDLDYIEAFELGIRRPAECRRSYPQCKSSLLDVISDEHNSLR